VSSSRVCVSALRCGGQTACRHRTFPVRRTGHWWQRNCSVAAAESVRASHTLPVKVRLRAAAAALSSGQVARGASLRSVAAAAQSVASVHVPRLPPYAALCPSLHCVPTARHRAAVAGYQRGRTPLAVDLPPLSSLLTPHAAASQPPPRSSHPSLCRQLPPITHSDDSHRTLPRRRGEARCRVFLPLHCGGAHHPGERGKRSSAGAAMARA
jgi:hypothetical protein